MVLNQILCSGTVKEVLDIALLAVADNIEGETHFSQLQETLPGARIDFAPMLPHIIHFILKEPFHQIISSLRRQRPENNITDLRHGLSKYGLHLRFGKRLGKLRYKLFPEVIPGIRNRSGSVPERAVHI